MREVTNWDKYHQRVQVSQRFLWTIWRAYEGLLAGIRCEKEFLLRDLFDLELGEKYDIVHSQGLLEKLHLWIYPDETAISGEEFAAGLESNGLEILKMKRCHFIELGAVCRRSVKRG